MHWDDLPDRKNGDKLEQRSAQRQETQSTKGSEEVQRLKCGEGMQTQDENGLKSHSSKSPIQLDVDNQHPSLKTANTDRDLNASADKVSEDVEKATRDLHLCNLSDAALHLLDSASAKAVGPPNADVEPTTEGGQDRNLDHHFTASANINISQVGMSKRGAAGLRHLLRCQVAAAEPDTIRLKLLGSLRRTFEEWCTAATQEFLYGTSGSHALPPPKVWNRTEEELDEDDLADDVTEDEQQGVSVNVPDYEKLWEDVQQQKQRVRGFYKGAWSQSERAEDPPGEKVSRSGGLGPTRPLL